MMSKEEATRIRQDMEHHDQGYDPYNSATTNWLWVLLNPAAQASKDKYVRSRNRAGIAPRVEQGGKK